MSLSNQNKLIINPDQTRGRVTTPPPQPKPQTGRITPPPPPPPKTKK